MTKKYYHIIQGDCSKVLSIFKEESIDCIVTDPPYGISFMGKKWDKALPNKEAFQQMFRVLKFGGIAFVMSSPRQDVLWRMMAMLEECGFQLRQSFISWIYKSGFPKAFDVSKGIDKTLGLKRKIIKGTPKPIEFSGKFDQRSSKDRIKDLPASDLAKKWSGWKSITGLKPALECILMVNKPLSEKTIVGNVLKHGVGAINMDACRIPLINSNENTRRVNKSPRFNGTHYAGGHVYDPRKNGEWVAGGHPKGRFPANLLVSDKALDTGKITKSSKSEVNKEESHTNLYGWSKGGIYKSGIHYGDVGGQSRYFDLDAWAKHHGFLDVAKPSKREKDKGLEKLPICKNLQGLDTRGRTIIREDGSKTLVERWKAEGRNVHPTVKPIKLMAYLIELGCPPNGVVLDPYLGSGTTMLACQRLNRSCVGVEVNPEYCEIIKARCFPKQKRLTETEYKFEVIT